MSDLDSGKERHALCNRPNDSLPVPQSCSPQSCSSPFMTVWVTERWAYVVGRRIVCARCHLVRPDDLPSVLDSRQLTLVPFTGTVLIGLLQLLTGHTVNRWETWNAVLKWMTGCRYCSPALLVLKTCQRLPTHTALLRVRAAHTRCYRFHIARQSWFF